MKTMTEIQSEIKEMSAKLSYLVTEISALNTSSEDVKNLDFKSLKALAVRNPINNHPLAEKSDDTKTAYFTLLVCIALMAKANQEKAFLLIQRLMCGTAYKTELENTIADSKTITEDHVDEFTMEIINDQLTEAFVLDSMMIYLACENKDEEMLILMSNLFQFLKCGHNQIKELSELAKILTAESEELYGEFRSKKRMINSQALTYYNDFFEKFPEDKGQEVLYIFKDMDNIMELAEANKDKNIIFRNVVFKKGILYFHNYKNLKFYECIFNDMIAYDEPALSFRPEISLKFYACKFISINSYDTYLDPISIDKEITVFSKCTYFNLTSCHEEYTPNYKGLNYDKSLKDYQG